MRAGKDKGRLKAGLDDAGSPFRADLGQRLGHLLNQFDSRNQASEVAGVSVDQLAGYVAGRNKISLEVASRLAEAKGFSLDWLAGRDRTGGHAESDYVVLPVFHIPAARGEPTIPGDVPKQPASFNTGWISDVLGVPRDNLVVAFNDGDQGVPDIRRGDLVLVDTRVHELKDDGCYLFGRGKDLMIRCVERTVDGGFALRSKSEGSPLQVFSAEDAKRLTVYGRIVWAGGPR